MDLFATKASVRSVFGHYLLITFVCRLLLRDLCTSSFSFPRHLQDFQFAVLHTFLTSWLFFWGMHTVQNFTVVRVEVE